MMTHRLPDAWQLLPLAKIANPKRRAFAMGPFGSRIRKENYQGFGVPVIRGLNLGTERFIDDGFVYLSEEKADELQSSQAFPEDVVFVAQGTIGRVGIIPKKPRYERYILSQNLMKVSCDPKEVDPLFVFYYFRSPYGQHEILSFENPTGVPCISQPLTSLKLFRVPLPPLSEQRTIAHILGTLDDKIELNRQMNYTLEAIARAIFKSWFVDFDPVHARAEGRAPTGVDAATAALFPDAFVPSELGLIPEGWEVEPLDEIAHYQNGLALQKYPPESEEFLPVIKIRELRQGRPDNKSGKASLNIKPSCILKDGDVVFSWSGSLLVDLWCGGRGALNQHLFKITSANYPKWFYYHWTKYHLKAFQRIAAGKATTMGHIQRRHLSEALALVPPKELLQCMSTVVTPLIEAIINNRLESRTLTQLRDTLLPKLISGELRVPEVLEQIHLKEKQ